MGREGRKGGQEGGVVLDFGGAVDDGVLWEGLPLLVVVVADFFGLGILS